MSSALLRELRAARGDRLRIRGGQDAIGLVLSHVAFAMRNELLTEGPLDHQAVILSSGARTLRPEREIDEAFTDTKALLRFQSLFATTTTPE